MLRLTLIAHPGARAERVSLLEGGMLGVWVRARPVEGQANAAIERVLASALGLRPWQVKVVGGTTSRRKIVEVDLAEMDVLQRRVLAYGLRPD
jgi:uncharacterized protein